MSVWHDKEAEKATLDYNKVEHRDVYNVTTGSIKYTLLDCGWICNSCAQQVPVIRFKSHAQRIH